MLPSNFELLKYDNPVLMMTKQDAPLGKGPKQQRRVTTETKSGTRSPSSRTETEDILDAILPPRQWVQDGQLWIQHVSSTPATRADVLTLQDQLDAKLRQRQAREAGICPVRGELYSQCFDELIRQVTVSCAERGLLLLRVRDEIKMTIVAYQTLYESSIAFGIRKALNAEQGKTRTEGRILELEKEKKELEKTVRDLKATVEQLERAAVEREHTLREKYNDEIQELKRSNAQIKAQLEGIISAKMK